MYSWLRYDSANNHSLFNILSSAVPEAYAYHPLASRSVSFIAVTLALGILIWFGLYRKAYALTGLILLLLAVNAFTLPLILQARGYGLMFLASVALFVSAFMYFRTGDRRFVIGFVAAAFVGGATIPLFAVFSALATFLLLVMVRRIDVTIIALVAGAIGTAFYAPIAGQIYEEAVNYGDIWGRSFEHISALKGVFGYLFPKINDAIFYSTTLFVAVTVVLYALARLEGPYQKFFFFTLTTVTGFLLFCFWLETPMFRTTQFIVAGPAVLLLATGDLRQSDKAMRYAVLGASLFLSFQMAVFGLKGAFQPRNPPLEAWGDVAETITMVSEPGTPVFASFRPYNLDVYLKDRNPIVPTFDAEAFARGKLIVVDSNFRAEERFRGTKFSPNAVDIRIAQNRGGFQVVSFVAEEQVARLTAPKANIASTFGRFPKPKNCPSPEPWKLELLESCDQVFVLFSDKARALNLSVDPAPNGDHKRPIQRVDRLASVTFGGQSTPSLDFSMKWWAKPWCQPLLRVWCDRRTPDF